MIMTIADVQGWLNGEKLRSEFLRKQYKLITLICGCIFVYILAGYHAMQQQHRLSDLRKEVRDKKFEYLTISSDLIKQTRQSQVVKTLKEQGSALQESTTPPIRISNE